MAIFIRCQFVICLGIWFHGSLFQIESFFHLWKAQRKKMRVPVCESGKGKGEGLTQALAYIPLLTVGQHKARNAAYAGICAVFRPVKPKRTGEPGCVKAVCQPLLLITPCAAVIYPLSPALSGVSVNWRGSTYITAMNRHIWGWVRGPADNTAGKIGFPPMAIRRTVRADSSLLTKA